MIKKGMCVYLLLISVVVNSSIYGQNNIKRFTIGVFGGIGIPVKPSIFQNDYQWSPSVGIDVTYCFLNNSSVCFDFTFQQFHLDNNTVKKEIEETFGPLGSVSNIQNGSMQLGMISINLMRYLHSRNRRFRFFLSAGGGIIIRKADEIQMNGSILNYQYDRTDTLNSETSFGLNGGMGFTLAFSDYIHLFIQGQYHHIFSEGIELWNPETFKVKNTGKMLSFICLKTGIRFIL